MKIKIPLNDLESEALKLAATLKQINDTKSFEDFARTRDLILAKHELVGKEVAFEQNGNQVVVIYENDIPDTPPLKLEPTAN